MRVYSGRRSAAFIALLGAILILTTSVSTSVAATAPAGLSRFLYAVGQVESGGDYTARNPTSGAYGKYQIMPSNWPAWAEQYLGDRYAPQTPANQEKVAAGKMTSLYRWLGRWSRVAYWWLTGSSKTSGWSDYATRYVNKVMTLYHQGSGDSTATVSARTLGDRNSAIDYAGTWRQASHSSYGGGTVTYATARGASATLRFSGSAISWNGPLGPTRGQAKVYVDGTYVKTVDLYRSAFDARAQLFRFTWKATGVHTIKIVVVGTSGRPMVAIDDFRIVD